MNQDEKWLYNDICWRRKQAPERGAIMMSQATQKSLIEWTAVSSCIITARFYSCFKNTTVIIECSVLEEGEQTRQFQITTGIKQGCVLSGFLFVLIVDWTIQRTTERHRNGIRWNFTSMLEDLDFADDIVLQFHPNTSTYRTRPTDQQIMGLKLNAQKCKVITITPTNCPWVSEDGIHEEKTK